MGWIQERLEWAVDNMLNQDSECVLVLNIDPESEVVASLEELREPPTLTPNNLVIQNGFITGVQLTDQPLQGTVWSERASTLYASTNTLITATDTLASDLAQTLKIPVEVHPQSLEQATTGSLFLISDEFGFVPIQTPSKTKIPATPATTKLHECFLSFY
jgi:hypothetical protein